MVPAAIDPGGPHQRCPEEAPTVTEASRWMDIVPVQPEFRAGGRDTKHPYICLLKCPVRPGGDRPPASLVYDICGMVGGGCLNK